MKYHILSLSECRDIVRERLEGMEPQVQGIEQGTGPGSVDWTQIRSTAEWMAAQLDDVGSKDRDQVEGKFALRLHTALGPVDKSILDDDGFWRYLGVRYFWDVIRWREPKAFGDESSLAKALKYVDATNPTESVLTRMYLRAVAVGMEDDVYGGDGEAAHGLPQATDFWRSHIVRVRTGTAPGLVRAFVRRQQDDRMATEPLREFAKAVNRTWSNIVLNVYGEDEASELLDDLHGWLQAEQKKEQAAAR